MKKKTIWVILCLGIYYAAITFIAFFFGSFEGLLISSVIMPLVSLPVLALAISCGHLIMNIIDLIVKRKVYPIFIAVCNLAVAISAVCLWIFTEENPGDLSMAIQIGIFSVLVLISLMLFVIEFCRNYFRRFLKDFTIKRILNKETITRFSVFLILFLFTVAAIVFSLISEKSYFAAIAAILFIPMSILISQIICYAVDMIRKRASAVDIVGGISAIVGTAIGIIMEIIAALIAVKIGINTSQSVMYLMLGLNVAVCVSATAASICAYLKFDRAFAPNSPEGISVEEHPKEAIE